MKKIAAIAAIALTMTGCASVSYPMPTPTLTPEQQYVQEVREVFLGYEDVSDRSLIKAGVSACDGLAKGLSRSQIYDIGTQVGWTLRETKALVAAAEKNLCNE